MSTSMLTVEILLFLIIGLYLPALMLSAYLNFWKRADLRWNRKLEDVEQLKNLQDELFDAASLYEPKFFLPSPFSLHYNRCTLPT